MEPNIKFKEFRKSQNLTQVELSEKLHVSQGTITDIERGRIGVSKKVKEKISKIFGIEIGYFNEKIQLKNNEIKQGAEIGSKWGFDTKNASFKERKLDEVQPYLSLDDSELDYEIKLEIEDWKSIFEDYRKLLEAIYKMEPPAFFKKKFILPPTFEEYRKSIESEYSPKVDNNGKENSFTKIDKILNLYKSEQEHVHHLLSLLIDYFNRYADFFLDEKEIKDSVEH